MTLKPITMPDLRDYQETDVTNIESAWERVNSVIYQLPTGGGKSVVLSKLILDYQDEDTLIIAHKRKLLKQLRGRLASHGLKTGYLQGITRVDLDAKVLIVSIRSAAKDNTLESLLKRKWKRIYIDEGRHTRTGTYDKFLDAVKEANPAVKILAVDATPYRKDGKNLDKHFQEMVVSCETVASLIEKGYLSQYMSFVTPIGNINDQVKQVANDYQISELSAYMRKAQFLKYVVDQYLINGDNEQAIVFAVDKAHAADMVEAFRAAGFDGTYKNKRGVIIHEACMINSDMSDAEIDDIYEAYEEGKVQILVNIEMATEGVDLPETGCIILARPTLSLTLYLQMVGRGVRPSTSGNPLRIIDCSGNTDRFGTVASPRQWSLDPNIDPNGLRTKNKIIGKKADGTFTENLDEFVGEVVEMTPEEYMQHLAGGAELAKTVNKTIEEKVQDIAYAMYEAIQETAKKDDKLTGMKFIPIFDFERREEAYLAFIGSYNAVKWEEITKEDHNRSTYALRRFARVLIDLNAKTIYAHMHEPESMSYNNTYSDYIHVCQAAGKLNKIFTDYPKVALRLKELYKQAKDLNATKININAIEQAQRQFKEEQYERTVDNWASTNGEFRFEKELDARNCFPKGDFYYSDYIAGIKVPSGNINAHHNTITLIIVVKDYDWKDGKRIYYVKSTKEIEKKYVKGEKVRELIKDGKWVVPTEETLNA